MVERTKIHFDSGGVECVGYLYHPISVAGMLPCVIMGTGFGWRNQVAPRVLFEMMRYKPSDKAHQLAMPVLVCLAEHDRETPADVARQIVEQAPRGELKSYPYAHFEFYRPEVRAQVVNDQIDFLRKHLMVKQR